METKGDGHTPRRSSRISGGAAGSRSTSSADEQEVTTAGGGTVVRRRKKLEANLSDVSDAVQQDTRQQQGVSMQEAHGGEAREVDRETSPPQGYYQQEALRVPGDHFQVHFEHQDSPRDYGERRPWQQFQEQPPPSGDFRSAEQEQFRAFQEFWAARSGFEVLSRTLSEEQLGLIQSPQVQDILMKYATTLQANAPPQPYRSTGQGGGAQQLEQDEGASVSSKRKEGQSEHHQQRQNPPPRGQTTRGEHMIKAFHQNQDSPRRSLGGKVATQAHGTHALSPSTHAKGRVSSKEILSLLTQCPQCGKANSKISGDPMFHYMSCNKKKTHFVQTTLEQQAVTHIAALRRRIHDSIDKRASSHEEVRESRRQEREQLRHGQRNLGSEDSARSQSSEEGVIRDRHGYEDEGDDDDDGRSDRESDNESDSDSASEYEQSSSEVSTSSEERQSKQRQKKGSKTVEAPNAELNILRQQIEAQQHAQNDALDLIRGLFSQVKTMSESVNRLTHQTGTAHAETTPNSVRVNQRQTSHSLPAPATGGGVRPAENEFQWADGRSSVQERSNSTNHDRQGYDRPDGAGALILSGASRAQAFDQDFSRARGMIDPGDQNYPEVNDKDLAVAGEFEKHKKAYKGYLSKCSSNHRQPVSLARTFEKWSEWIAVIFTEQEKQKSESQGRSQHRYFNGNAVMELTDEDFEMRYLEMCGINMKDPSQVLDFLREPVVDVSSGSLSSLMAASESFRKKLRQVPARALHSTTSDRIRNAYVESLFGEERGKRKRVDYDSMETWEDVVQHLARVVARAPNGVAFEAFKPLPVFASNSKQKKGKSQADDSDESGSEQGQKRKDQDSALCAGVDMRITSEKKWYKRYRYFANKNKISMDGHGGSGSWKTRYRHIVDMVDKKSGRCTRCKQKGHMASACDDPCLDVLYPVEKQHPSSSPARSERRDDRREDRRDDRRDERRDDRREDRRDSRRDDRLEGRRDDQREERRDDRHDDRRDLRYEARYRDSSRDHYRRERTPDPRYDSRSRDYYRSDRGRSSERVLPQSQDRDQRDRTPDGQQRSQEHNSGGSAGRSQSRHDYSRQQNSPARNYQGSRVGSRDSSQERRGNACYNCGEEGHLARDCKKEKRGGGRA
jgi:hypothetical protein